MKYKLLFLVFVCCSFMSAFSQVAHQRPDLSVCNSEVFDLTVQTPVILGGLSGIFPDWKKGFILLVSQPEMRLLFRN